MDPVVHFELPYENRERMAAFYSSAFGWRLQMLGEEMGNYVLATTAEADAMDDAPRGAINGGFHPRRADIPAQYPSVVIGVGDLRAAMRRVTDAGGEVLGEPMTIPGVGDYVAFLDSEGNRNSMIQPMTPA